MYEDKEIWKPLKGYEETHEISTHGRCRRLTDGRVYKKGDFLPIKKMKSVKKSCSPRYYFKVNTKNYLINRAVALTFLDNPLNKEEVNHIDGDTSNNLLTNLEWSTRKENTDHAFDNGLISSNKKVKVVGIGEFRSIAKASESLRCSRPYLSKTLKEGKGKAMINGYTIEYL